MAVTFTRNSTAYKKDGTHVNTNQPRFEAGRFGQAVMGEEGTTNLLPAAVARCESGIWSNNSADTTLSFSSAFGRSSVPSVRMEQVSTTRFAGYSTPTVLSVSAGMAYTHSVYIFSVNRAIATTIQIFWRRADGTTISTTNAAHTSVLGQWTRLTVTGIAPEETAQLRGVVQGGTIAVGDILWFDDLQLEQKAYPTSWHEATRAPETLTIPTASVLSPAVGTNEKYVRLLRSPGTNEQFIFDGGGAANRNLQILIATNGRPTLRYGTGTATVEIQGTTAWARDTWYAIAWRWGVAGVTLFVNGAVVASSAIAPDLAFGDVAWLGSRADGTLQVGGLADDIRISSVARTDAEILSGFSSGLPLPVDMDTTAKYLFDNTLDAVKQASGSSSAAVGITTQGAGSKQARAGSATALATTSQGVGSKQARAGSSATVTLDSQGAGSKRGQGGSYAPLGISAQGWGYKLLRRIIRLVGTLREKIKLKGVL